MFKKLCEMNWDYAEPGILFWDRISNYNLISEDPDFEYAGTNPCAEEPLPAGGSCLLGSLNLSEFVVGKSFDAAEFRRAVRCAVIALNEVLDEGLPLHPLREQQKSVRDWRQIGLGIFGLADMLIKMEVRYGSDIAIDICNEIGFIMADEAIKTSATLAKKIATYPNYKPGVIERSNYFLFNTTKETKDLVCDYGMRNSQLLTIAPTGTLSTMLGVSGGIEPIYANYYMRKTESLHGEDVYYKVYTPIVDKFMKENGLEDDSELPDYFITAQTLDYKERIKMQAIWQEHIDASISSTVNVPNEFTVNDTIGLYTEAWKAGLKGVTIFRDGCKRLGVLSTSETSNEPELGRGDIIKVSNDCIGKKRTLITGCGTLHCTAFFDKNTGALLETYLSKGSTGGCNNFMVGLSRMISLSARGGISVYDIVDQLKSSGTCPSYAVRFATKKDTSKGSCCPVAVGNALIDMYEELQEELGLKESSSEDTDVKNKCPECGEELTFEGGCNTCKNCGYSKCE